MQVLLPMKVIKVGTSSLSRIAQACDRCRSKKIRCDGVRPWCSPCHTVGFECRTSDKLSRRAFPRGYTESLEERVRQLEAELRDVRDLLEEKDTEMDDILSKVDDVRQVRPRPDCHSALAPQSPGHALDCSTTSPPPSPGSSDTASPSFATLSGSTTFTASSDPPTSSESTLPSSNLPCPTSSTLTSSYPGKGLPLYPHSSPVEDKFRVHPSPLLLGLENSDSYFMGLSSGRGLIDSLKRRLQDRGKSCANFNTDAFLHIQGCPPLTSTPPDESLRIPPRLFSDRCIHQFFQEWAPLFPVLHKPIFLRTYEEFVADPDKFRSDYKLAQLYLVFSIAGASSASDTEQVAACDAQWQRALGAVVTENTMHTLQCLVLALIYCSLRADSKLLQHYKSIAVGLSHRLGLHLSQKQFSYNALTTETKKRVFWTLYTLDCFSAAALGLPKMLKDEDIQAELPSDADDEYVTEKGVKPSLSGEYSRLSSGLALFRLCRILAKVLSTIYPTAASYELSLQQMSDLAIELDSWWGTLPNHHQFRFGQDQASPAPADCRAPLLALAYYYVRTLIYRPAIGSSLGPKAQPAVQSVAECSQRLLQLVELLQERGLAFAFCINRTDLLVMCGVTVLFQTVDPTPGSQLTMDSERLLRSVVKALDGIELTGIFEFRRLAGAFIHLDDPPVYAPQGPYLGESAMAITQVDDQVQARVQPRIEVMAYSNPKGRLTAATASQSAMMPRQEPIRWAPAAQTHPRQVGLGANPCSSHGFSLNGRVMNVHYDGREMRVCTPQVVGSQPCFDFTPVMRSPDSVQVPSSTPNRSWRARQFNDRRYPARRQQGPGLVSAAAAGGGSMPTVEWQSMLGSLNGFNNFNESEYTGSGDVPLGIIPSAISTSAASPACADWSSDIWSLSQMSGQMSGGSDVGSVLMPSDHANSTTGSGEQLGLEMGVDLDYADIGMTSEVNLAYGGDKKYCSTFSPATPAIAECQLSAAEGAELGFSVPRMDVYAN